MTFSKVWYTGVIRLLNRWVGTDEFNNLLEWMEHEAMCAADNDAELCAIYECAAIAQAIKGIAERDDIRSREIVRAINTAVSSASWVLDEFNSWAFKMVKDPESGKWVMQGVAFETLKNKGVKTHE